MSPQHRSQHWSNHGSSLLVQKAKPWRCLQASAGSRVSVSHDTAAGDDSCDVKPQDMRTLQTVVSSHQGSSSSSSTIVQQVDPVEFWLKQGLANVDATSCPSIKLSGQHNSAWLYALCTSAELLLSACFLRQLYSLIRHILHQRLTD